MAIYSSEEKLKFRATYQALRDWYGAERAGVEIVEYCPHPVSVGDEADKILRKMISKEVMDMQEIRGHWEDIAGAQIAKVAHPLNIKNKVFYAEVEHPVWLRELNGPVKKMLLDKINRLCGEAACRDIRFVPKGR
jgi:predicted nucleic acid-binding Zn ribbon protein